MEKKWVRRKHTESDINDFLNGMGFTKPFACALAGQGLSLDDLDHYFNASLKNLSSPYRIPGIETAVERLWKAVKSGEHIIIYGDFDVDGITASAVLSWLFSENSANVNVFIPQRADLGYGFSPESLDQVLSLHKCNVIVTVDCGITSCEAVEKAKLFGIDTIITDHHERGEELPDAFAVINPKIHSEISDLHCLAGVGVAFKLAHAFVKYGIENKLLYTRVDLREVLDLVALGTVADIVPLVGENRILTKYGLKILAMQARPGIRALCDVCGIVDNLKSRDIAFRLAPLINAGGRLGDPGLAYKLLSSNSIVTSMQLVEKLKEYNLQRRLKEEEILNEAEFQIKENIKIEDAFTLLVYGENWHHGVIGNVASRIARNYNRPSIVLTTNGDVACGSGRSFGNVNLVEFLAENSDILNRYGGHPMAIGLSLNSSDVKDLCLRFEQAVGNMLTKEDLIPQIEYDGNILISEIDEEFFGELARLEPFGHSNYQPIYRINNLSVPYKTFFGKFHTRGYVKDCDGNSLEFIAFNYKPDELPEPPWNILASPQKKGANTPQLKIVDIESLKNAK